MMFYDHRCKESNTKSTPDFKKVIRSIFSSVFHMHVLQHLAHYAYGNIFPPCFGQKNLPKTWRTCGVSMEFVLKCALFHQHVSRQLGTAKAGPCPFQVSNSMDQTVTLKSRTKKIIRIVAKQNKTKVAKEYTRNNDVTGNCSQQNMTITQLSSMVNEMKIICRFDCSSVK